MSKLRPNREETYVGIHGFRVVTSFLVVAFHAYLYWAAGGDQTLIGAQKRIEAVNRNVALKLLSFANLSVDGLIVLSGFLAGRSFLSSSSASSSLRTFSLQSYLMKKVKRILVPYWVTIAAIMVLVQLPTATSTSALDPIFGREYCPRTLVLSPLLLNNFIGFGGCGVHLWSVAVQMHLFTMFGLACKACVMTGWGNQSTAWSLTMSRKSAMAATLLVLITTIIMRIALASYFGARFPPPPFDHHAMTHAMQDVAMRYYHVLYFATPSRATNFVAGVLLSLLLWDPSSRTCSSGSGRWTPRARRLLRLVTLPITLAYLALLASVDYSGRDWPPWSAALLFHGSPVASFVMTLLLASAIVHGTEHPIRGVNFATVRWLSDRSYLLYLCHPLIMRLAAVVAGLLQSRMTVLRLNEQQA